MDLKPKTKTAVIIILIIIGIIVAFSLTQTKIITHNKPVLTDAELKCQTDSDCQKVNLDCCDNNIPQQNTCINRADAVIFKQQLDAYCRDAMRACPMILMLAYYSCSCENSVCVTTVNTTQKVFSYSGIYNGT